MNDRRPEHGHGPVSFQTRTPKGTGFRSLAFSLAWMLGWAGWICGARQAWGNDSIAGGDFASLDGWEFPQAPEDAVRRIIPENSPFTDVLGDNGTCFSAKNSLRDVIRQEFAPVSGKVTWSFDFRMKPVDPETGAGAGHLVILLKDGERHCQVNVGRIARFSQSTSTAKETGWSTPRGFQLQEDVWWHFSCEIDFENQTYRIFMRSEGGDVLESEPVIFPQDGKGTRTEVDAILIRGGGGGPNKSAEMYFDNISLRPAP